MAKPYECLIWDRGTKRWVGVLAIASLGEPVRVTAITRPVLCRTRSPGDQHENIISLHRGNRRAQEDAGGGDPPAVRRAGRIRETDVRHDSRRDPALGGLAAGSRS